MKGWVGLVGWPIADGLPILVVTHQLQVERRTGKVRWPETDVLPLCHATNDVKLTFDFSTILYGGQPRNWESKKCLIYSVITQLRKFGNKTANIHIKNCSLSKMLTATDLKPQKSLKGDITQHHVDIQAMWRWVISPLNDLCGFWSVAVNIMDKLQFLIFTKL